MFKTPVQKIPPPSTNLHLKIIMLLQRAEEPSPGYKEGLSEG